MNQITFQNTANNLINQYKQLSDNALSKPEKQLHGITVDIIEHIVDLFDTWERDFELKLNTVDFGARTPQENAWYFFMKPTDEQKVFEFNEEQAADDALTLAYEELRDIEADNDAEGYLTNYAKMPYNEFVHFFKAHILCNVRNRQHVRNCIKQIFKAYHDAYSDLIRW